MNCTYMIGQTYFVRMPAVECQNISGIRCLIISSGVNTYQFSGCGRVSETRFDCNFGPSMLPIGQFGLVIYDKSTFYQF